MYYRRLMTGYGSQSTKNSKSYVKDEQEFREMIQHELELDSVSMLGGKVFWNYFGRGDGNRTEIVLVTAHVKPHRAWRNDAETSPSKIGRISKVPPNTRDYNRACEIIVSHPEYVGYMMVESDWYDDKREMYRRVMKDFGIPEIRIRPSTKDAYRKDKKKTR